MPGLDQSSANLHLPPLLNLPSFTSSFDTDMTDILNRASHQPDATPLLPVKLAPAQETATSATHTNAHNSNSNSNSFLTHHYPHQHRGSVSTTTTESESNDSSPTTTVSSVTDPSPSSSPESPINIVRLSSFSSKNNGTQSLEDLLMHPPPSPLPQWKTRPISPASKRPRNTKNLSIMMAVPSRQPPPPPPAVQTAAATQLTHDNSAPPSPSFVLPPKPPRKRPSNLGLTIQTPGLSAMPSKGLKGLKGLSIVPPTPANRPHLLRHHQSSPSLSLFSPGLEVSRGGMQLPPINSSVPTLFNRPRQSGGLSQQTAVEPASAGVEHTSPVILQQLAGLQEEEDYDPPLSQEVKSPSYPSGPVCIYDPHVFLYLEPNDEEAGQFDVIFNVAREVKNPFVVARERKEKEASALSSERQDVTMVDDLTTPATATSVATFQTAYENQPTPTTASPTTPRATIPKREPEYIHIPWDHNTAIVDDLLNLVEVIDERVRQGKRVLIHCQCGVSRSASLIVAYGLFKNPSLTVQEAYDTAKRRSKWIGPNMSLIYQLSEFRTKLHKKLGVQQPAFRSWRSGNGGMGLMGNGRANTITSSSPTSRPSLGLDTYDHAQREPPQTAPLPEDRDRTPVRSGPQNDAPMTAMAAIHGSNIGDATPGQSTAPLNTLSWPLPSHTLPEPETTAESSFLSKPTLDANKCSVPESEPSTMEFAFAREEADCAPPSQTGGFVPIGLPPSRPAPVPGNDSPSDIRHQEISYSGAMESGIPTPDLLSPRTEMMGSPFGRSNSYAFGAVPLASPGAMTRDPRSPAQRGEAPIVRSIFDVL